jgi:predicted alpha-1,2-mannosidase
MKKSVVSPAIFLAFMMLSLALTAQKSPVDYVNPFIGTGGHGHTYPGATMPFGMVQLSPDTRLEGWDGCGGYHYNDEYIYGFSHTHLSGTGVPDLCDILFMPTTGEPTVNNGADGQAGYRSHFSHKSESATAGYYKVQLDDYNITAELTATERVGFHQYTFPASDKANIIIDLFHRDDAKDASIRIRSESEIEGMRVSKGWADNQVVYFVAQFSKPFTSYCLAANNVLLPGKVNLDNRKNVKAYLQFKTAEGEKILVKVGISATSIAGARKNLEKELSGWDFEQVRNNARDAWNKELSKIIVEGGTDDQKKVFYTALYHTMVVPNTYMDVDGTYRGRDFKNHRAEGFTNYTVFSLWDTYRAYHPLMTIIDQKRTLDFIRTFLAQYDQGGLLPVWELQANETWCMIGYHSIPVIVDAYLKGITGFDANKAFDAMKKSATRDNAGLKAYDQMGFIPSDREAESVSKTLEYAYDDWCIAQYAAALGKKDEYKYFIRRAQSYKHLIDPSTGNVRARINGGWYSPFDPTEVNYNFTEANSWQYTFAVTQDMTGFANILGGKDKLAAKLDALFSASTQTTGRDQSDITGLIGQYAHGNEPSHHIAYLYPFAGQPWKTQELVHRILNEFYHNNPDGLIGNEDCGQMSAWAVLSAMGFYSANPGSDFYVIGTPWFDKVTINLENGKHFVIKANNISASNFYIQSATLNGKTHGASFLKHADIMKGGELVFTMGGQPNTDWGVGKKKEPVTAITDNLVLPAPYLNDPVKAFTGTKKLEFAGPADASIMVMAAGSDRIGGNIPYTAPIEIAETSKVKFFAQQKKLVSPTVTAEFVKTESTSDCKLITSPASQYSGNGGLTLVDKMRGADDFRVGGWLGFEKVNLEAVIDLRTKQPVAKLSAGFLQDENAWIFMPTQVEYFLSDDGVNFTSAGIVKNDIRWDKWGVIIKNFDLKISPTEARYIKVIGTNMGTCPEGHKGNSGPAWIFADEITVE